MSNTNKTVRQWLETLPLGYKELALENATVTDQSADSMMEAIDAAFLWGETPEGEEFWGAAFDHYSTADHETQLKLPELPEPPPSVNAAIATLQIQLDTLNNNEPIWRSEGNIEQADASLKNAQEIHNALEILRK